MIDGRIFAAAYAVAPPASRTGDSPNALSIEIYEMAPKTDKERKDACDAVGGAPPFAASGRSMSVHFEEKSKRTSSSLVLHAGAGPKSNWMPEKGKAMLFGEGRDLAVEINAEWDGKSCQVRVPVFVCN